MDRYISTQDLLRRKSVRKYAPDWDEQRTRDILDVAAELEPLVPGIPVRFVAVDGADVVGQGKADAPCYVALYSVQGEGWAENAGFLLYQLSVILSKNGVGSVPRSGSEPKSAPREAEGVTMAMLLSVGLPGEELYRNVLESPERKSLDEVCVHSDPRARQIVEYGRIAPSSGNGQPWFFGGDSQRIDVYAQLAGDVFNTRNTELKLLDVGMACYGLALAAKEANCCAGFVQAQPEAAGTPKGFVYNRSLRLQ